MIEYESLERSNRPFAAGMRGAFERVLGRGWYVLGEEVHEFEREFADYVGSPHCVGVASGLDALTLSIRALELPPASEILVPSNTYIATILAILHAGHRPVLVEPDLRSYNIDPNLLPAALMERTRAICVTHLYGKPCRMDAIMPFAQRHRLAVIEDCAQSHGALLNGRHTGTFGNAGCYSFYPTKNLGALGDGGAVVTADAALAEQLRELRNYGSTQKYVNVQVGVNSRLDELQAAFLRVKLPALPDIVAHKRRLAAVYHDALPPQLTLPLLESGVDDAHHIYPVRTERRDALRAALLGDGIKTEVHYPIPPHRQRAMKGIVEGDYPIADEIHATEMSLPISFGTSVDDAAAVCNAIRRFFDAGATGAS